MTVKAFVEGRPAPVELDVFAPVGSVLPPNSADGLPFVAALANNDVVSLAAPLVASARVCGLTAATREGWHVMFRSFALLLSAAARRALPPGVRLRVRHSLRCGIFASLRDSEDGPERPATDSEAAAVEREMRAMAEEDLPITEETCGYEEAVARFAAEGRHDEVGLLSHRNEPVVVLVRCGSFATLRQGPCAPRAGLLGAFSLFAHDGGLVLQIPSREDPGRPAPFVPEPELVRIHRDHARWGDLAGVRCAADLNEAVAQNRIGDVVEMSEALHDREFAKLAARIAERKPRPRLILIAGPSSAGKTTSCRRLAIHLRVLGLRPVQISTDDYFVPEAEDPIGPDGKPDYEDIRAVDVPALRSDMAALLRGESVRRRTFDFVAHHPVWPGDSLRLGADGVVMVEGIHALNPTVSEGIPREATFKIYLSALPQLGIDDASILSSTDNRLVRRIVRDRQFRGRCARETLAMWGSVRRGEEKWIFPWQSEADTHFNSSLDYELSVLRPFAAPLLAEVKPSDPEYAAARRLLAVLRNFHSIPATSVPGDSILREYIGGSLLRY